MARAGLMLDIAHGNLLVGEACGKLLRHRDESAAIVAHIDDEGVARGEIEHHVVEIAVADGILETLAAYVADIVVELPVFQTACDAIVRAEIAALQSITEVLGVSFLPAPVAGIVEAGKHIDVAVAQFAEHIAEHLEKL